MGDVVSFSAKKYDANSVVNPTNHCAYCGCKVYNEEQLDSIAKEILLLKADRLQGKLKSVLEKLGDAKNSQEISIAKRLENKEQVDFFNNFLNISSKKTFYNGAEIFKEEYNLDSDEALEELKKNLHPLLRTIDHVTPQNEEKDNDNSDINLVESCYCCNHDLKKGVAFSDFYTMFPSIRNNMPKEKFEYAASNLLETSPNTVLQRLSASDLIKLVERLFMQKAETENNLNNINSRIKDYCKNTLDGSIESFNSDILEKEDEIKKLSKEYDELKKDPEFNALLQRNNLTKALESEQSVLTSRRESRQRLSNSINELKSSKHSNKKSDNSKQKLTKEEKEAKIQSLKSQIAMYSSQISQNEDRVLELQLQIQELDEKFPTIEMLQAKKSRNESILNSHTALRKEQALLEEKKRHQEDIDCQIKTINDELYVMSQTMPVFELGKYTSEEQKQFADYQAEVEAVRFIDEHPTSGSIKALINNTAREQMKKEIDELSKSQIVKDYLNDFYRNGLEQQLKSLQKEKIEVQKSIENSQKSCRNYSNFIGTTSVEVLQNENAQLSETIKRLTDKTNSLKIPQIISTLKAEITLINQTISDLKVPRDKITKTFNMNA
jgi:hypothetical protein